MKKLVIILGILISGMLLWQSCTKDSSLTGDIDAREAFVGNWSVTDVCSKQTYGVNIQLNANNSAEVIIENFANLGQSATAVIADNSIYVEKQDVGNGYSVSGNGLLSGEVIAWPAYNFETDGESTECSATFKK